MNLKEGFDRLSLVASVAAAVLSLVLVLIENDWRPPASKGEGTLLLGLCALAGVGVWYLTRVVGWVVRGFIQQRREPPA
jgi:uncharacterized membrane protein